MRDEDGLKLLTSRDYDLIRHSFDLGIAKLGRAGLIPDNGRSLKCSKYRLYNQAFYEELLIDFRVEERVAQNYRERFVTTEQEVLQVLEMYCKQDYHEYFNVTDKANISHK